MSLLLDHNLSARLVPRLQAPFPGATHVASEGMSSATDTAVWKWAKEHGFAILTKDADFNDLAVLNGPPPQVIWLRPGNCTTAQVEATLSERAGAIRAFLDDGSAAVLVLRG